MNIRQQIEQATGFSIAQISPLTGGSVGQVYRLKLAGGPVLVAKVDDSAEPRLDVEGFMLDFLREKSGLPLPETVYSSPSLLIMSHLPGDSVFPPSAQEHAAELLAELHSLTAPAYGLDRPTLIGGIHQPNPWSASWIPFFAEQRLLYMAQQGIKAGRLPQQMAGRIEKMAARLSTWLEEPAAPSLIHGDVWTTNVLAANGRITGFLDPAIYYASPEIELAFTQLFSSFGDPFFRRYQEIRPISKGFFTERCDIYNLYPLLVHVQLFGGGYVNRVDRILKRFGF